MVEIHNLNLSKNFSKRRWTKDERNKLETLLKIKMSGINTLVRVNGMNEVNSWKEKLRQQKNSL
jgi:hypothetical protein